MKKIVFKDRFDVDNWRMDKLLKIHGLDLTVTDFKAGEVSTQSLAGVHPDVQAAHTKEMVRMGIDENLQQGEIAFTFSPAVGVGTEVLDDEKKYVVTSVIGLRSRACAT
jgi:hypothetical protein